MHTSKYLIVKGHAGLGDRIGSLIVLILYARLSRRILMVDWRDSQYSNNKQNSFLDLFKIQNISSASEIPAYTSIRPSIWKGNLDKSVGTMMEQDQKALSQSNRLLLKKYSIDISQIDYPEDILVGCSYFEQITLLRRYFKGKFSTYKKLSNEEIFKKIFQKNLKISSSISKRVASFKKQHFSGKFVIGIHVRQSDKKISLMRYRKALEEALKKYSSNITIFLATDNRAVEVDFQERYSNVVVTSKWLPPPGERVHGHRDCPNRQIHAVESLVDMLLLTHCNYLIYSRTTMFSKVSRLLTSIPSDCCFDIQRYEDERNKPLTERAKNIFENIKNKFIRLKDKLRIKSMK